MKLRIERWLRHSNGPLVTALTEHESILDQLATAQELRVKSANEVVATMKLIAGTAAHARPLPPTMSQPSIFQTRLRRAATHF
jgi:hypothetical protein